METRAGIFIKSWHKKEKNKQIFNGAGAKN